MDYWWFLRYNHFRRYGMKHLCRSGAIRKATKVACSEHEGDWEGVTVVTAIGDPSHLDSVGFAQHTGVFRRSADQLEYKGQRPVVYIADGSHASYSKVCPKSCHQEARIILGIHTPEDDTNGRADWGRNDASACEPSRPCLLPIPENSWGDYNGLWGSKHCGPPGGACVLATPPRSPSRQLRFKAPWCFTSEDGEPACDTRRFVE